MSAILGESLLFPQRNGPQIRLTVFGDEFYSYQEDDNGYSVIYDPEIGLYTYARLMGGMLTSTGVPLHQDPPAGVKRHLRESQEVIASKFEEKFARNYASRDGAMRVLGRNMGLLDGRRVNQGKVLGLTIIVQFSVTRTPICSAACLMSYGNHLNNGKTPAPICAYLRNLAGWCDNAVNLNEAGEYQANHGDYGSVLIYKTDNENEYFIVENRTALGLDEYLPSSGLAVYHCDIFGSNEWQGGTPQHHYQCGLLQADGHLDLEKNRNEGDASDLFGRIDGLALSHDTLPSSCQWDLSESGLTISNIGEPGQVIVSSVITLSEKGKISAMRVSLDITHTYIGDLKVELISPSGLRAVLHNREGGNKDNLIVNFDTESNQELKAFLGQPSNGDWTLWVADLAKIDTGKLNRWSIEQDLAGYQPRAKGCGQVEQVGYGIYIPGVNP